MKLLTVQAVKGHDDREVVDHTDSDEERDNVVGHVRRTLGLLKGLNTGSDEKSTEIWLTEEVAPSE